ncbi:MAG: endolytic transglycosylase MltG [Thermodesulfobacteriota bacterium]
MKFLLSKKIQIPLLTILIIVFVIALIFFYDLKKFSSTPTSFKKTETQIFTIEKGQSFSRTAVELKKKNLINNIIKFKILAKLNKKERKIQAGEYSLSPAMTPDQILTMFVKGRVNLVKLTIPEGYTIFQIAAELEKKNICKSKNFTEKTNDKDLLYKYSIPGPSFEGYLYPETYFFKKDSDPEKIIQTMVSSFKNHYTKDLKKRASEIGFTDHEAVTLASIIEKETGKKSEREIISSVFHNRLKKGMRLETDPTVIYGIKDFDGNIKKRDLQHKTPYNTYMIKGLPPGPIANPGIKSIKAALYPAETDYLFFVSKKDGSHYFSTSYKEHLKAVNKYQLGR